MMYVRKKMDYQSKIINFNDANEIGLQLCYKFQSSHHPTNIHI